MESDFDLLTEPWIEVEMPDGAHKFLGIRDVLLQSHKINAVVDPIPIVEFGIRRLLTAIVLDAIVPGGLVDLAKLISASRFDDARIESYLDEWSDRFRLFDPIHPFLQTPGMEGETKPLAGLLPPIPQGTNSLHFHRSNEADFCVSPAAAARLLTTIAPFMTAGGAGLSPSINGAPPWYAWISRPDSTLHEQLLLNCCATILPTATTGAGPAWRNTRPFSDERATKASLLESLTWQPRKVQLVRGTAKICAITGEHSEISVNRMRFSAGRSSGFEPTWIDPAVPYRASDKGLLALRPQPGRHIWRDLGAIALLPGDDNKNDRPVLVTQFDQVYDEMKERVPAWSGTSLTIEMYAMRTDMKMKIFEWYRERLQLPIEIVHRREPQAWAIDGMKRAETLCHRLRKAIRIAYPRDGKGNDHAFETLIENAESIFWNTLQPAYTQFILDIAKLDPDDDEDTINDRRKKWSNLCFKEGLHVLDWATEGLDTDAKEMHRVVKARDMFLGLDRVAAKDKPAKAGRSAKAKG